jgi:hypothetical protein
MRQPNLPVRRGRRKPRQPISSPSADAMLRTMPNVAKTGRPSRKVAVRGDPGNPKAVPSWEAKAGNA